jgi:hypothetical protein
MNMIRWGAESAFSQRTIDPFGTEMDAGKKAKFRIFTVLSETDAWLIGVGTGVVLVCAIVTVGDVVTGAGADNSAGCFSPLHPATAADARRIASNTREDFIPVPSRGGISNTLWNGKRFDRSWTVRSFNNNRPGHERMLGTGIGVPAGLGECIGE